MKSNIKGNQKCFKREYAVNIKGMDFLVKKVQKGDEKISKRDNR